MGAFRSPGFILVASAAVICILVAPSPISARIHGRCELAAELKAKGITNTQDIATWVCIAERLSSIETNTATDPDDDPDGTVYHGIFLISSRWWCDRGKKGCGVTCEDMKQTLGSNIACAKKVFAETKSLKGNGFMAWGAYDDCKEPADLAEYVADCRDVVGDQDEELDLSVFARSSVPGTRRVNPNEQAEKEKNDTKAIN